MSGATARIVLLMGVSGSGKSTLGALLAERLCWSLVEGDDLHPPANVEKMASGRPLDDDDRRPWLEQLRQAIDGHLERREPAVVTCSALKASYREQLGCRRPTILLVHLTGTRELLATRLAERRRHFMPSELLDSQLAALEPPREALVLDVAEPPERLVEQICSRLGSATGS